MVGEARLCTILVIILPETSVVPWSASNQGQFVLKPFIAGYGSGITPICEVWTQAIQRSERFLLYGWAPDIFNLWPTSS